MFLRLCRVLSVLSDGYVEHSSPRLRPRTSAKCSRTAYAHLESRSVIFVRDNEGCYFLTERSRTASGETSDHRVQFLLEDG